MNYLRLFCITVILSISSISYGQNDSVIEAMMTRRVLYCSDVTLNATTLLPSLHAKRDTQLINQMLIFWAKKCGVQNVPLTVFKTIYSIEQNTFKEENIQLWQLNDYRHTVKTDTSLYYHLDYKSIADDTFFSFIKHWSESLLQRDVDYSKVERYLLEFFVNPSDGLLEKIKTKEFEGTRLQSQQRSVDWNRNRYKRYPFHLSFTGGLWMPTNELSKIGTKGTIGFQMGYVNEKIKIYADLLGKLTSKGDYIYTYKDDSLFYVNKQHGVYVGVGFNYQLLKIKNQGLEVITGLGYEGITFVLEEGKRGAADYTKDVSSVNANIGLGYRYHINSEGTKNFLGFDVRYHYLNYRNKNGTNLMGNAITVGLNVGLATR